MIKGAKKSTNTGKVLFSYAVVYLVWGSTFFFIEKALHSFSPFVLGSLRFIFAASLLMGYCKFKGYKLFQAKAVMQACIIGFLLLFIDMAGVIWAEQYISSGIVAIISAAAAIWFVLLDKSKWKENFSSPPIVIGLFMGFFGVIMLFAEQIGVASNNGKKTESIIALAALVIGSLAWTVGSLYSKYSNKRAAQENAPRVELNVMVQTAWQMTIAGILFTITAFATGEYARFDYTAVAIGDWWALIYLIFFGSILAFSSYIWLIQERPSTEVSTYAYVNPIVAVFLSHFFTTHKVTSLQIIGLVIILASVLLMNWNLYKNNKRIKRIRKIGMLHKRKHTVKSRLRMAAIETKSAPKVTH
ncbi:EamA family transporter [Sphingobacteriaceae bacterium WQ 2009]|uniref:EamA family transporter n=1 Tax=Rhinopithecimicrobium faecis TaxID=2820698 RepID=A0A8T4HDJ1_9SPHI|nr:EamA family transporter [Sphingobacteriaceae bacterium WQ 2009]